MQAISSFIFKIFILLFLFVFSAADSKESTTRQKPSTFYVLLANQRQNVCYMQQDCFSNKFFIVLNWDDVNIQGNRHTVNSQLRSLRIFH